MDRSYDVITFYKTFIWRSPRVTNFADIIKIVAMLLKHSLKTQKKLKEVEIMYWNAIYIYISGCSRICWFPVKNAYVSRTQGVCHMIDIYFWSSLDKV